MTRRIKDKKAITIVFNDAQHVAQQGTTKGPIQECFLTKNLKKRVNSLEAAFFGACKMVGLASSDASLNSDNKNGLEEIRTPDLRHVKATS